MKDSTEIQAFPDERNFGISIRDYFAARALQGMLASGNLPKTMPDADIAECSYNLADAMMKQRQRKEVPHE